MIKSIQGATVSGPPFCKSAAGKPPLLGYFLVIRILSFLRHSIFVIRHFHWRPTDRAFHDRDG
jgi:hypothetical protein